MELLWKILGVMATWHMGYIELSCKGEAIPLQACTGPEGSRRLRLQDFMTFGT